MTYLEDTQETEDLYSCPNKGNDRKDPFRNGRHGSTDNWTDDQLVEYGNDKL